MSHMTGLNLTYISHMTGKKFPDKSNKCYLKSVQLQLEQAQVRVFPKQATPMFFDTFYKIVVPLRTLLQDHKISPTERYILSRDLAFFTLNFSSRDRASDVCIG